MADCDLDSHDHLASDADFLRRRWLPVDCDPVRPAGISASDAEHELALARGREIRTWLAERGWPNPVMADSGNGAHLLYRIDEPANDSALVAGVLAGLAARLDDERVKIDQKVGNAARIWKLYGTMGAKGDHLPERPHHLARMLRTVRP